MITDNIMVVFPYVKGIAGVISAIRRFWPILELHACFQNKWLMVAYSRGANLGDLMVRHTAKEDSPLLSHTDLGHFHCGSCLYCHSSITGRTWMDIHTSLLYISKWHTTCESSFVVLPYHMPLHPILCGPYNPAH